VPCRPREIRIAPSQVSLNAKYQDWRVTEELARPETLLAGFARSSLATLGTVAAARRRPSARRGQMSYTAIHTIQRAW
jgi:hypothetical protein